MTIIYEVGTWGPAAADELIAQCQVPWHHGCVEDETSTQS